MGDFLRSTGEINTLEILSESGGAMRRLHPMTHLTVTLIYIVTVMSCGSYDLGRISTLFVYPIIAAVLADIPFRLLARRLMSALPFAFFAGISNVFFDKTVVMQLGGLAVSGGAVSFLTVLLKTLLCVWSVLILAASVPMHCLFAQLIVLKLPEIFVTQLMLTYRYLQLLLSEAAAMSLAYRLRSPKHRGIDIKNAGSFLGSLILRSISRAERIYYAMCCRGFSGSYPHDTCGRAAWGDAAYAAVWAGLIITFRLTDLSSVIGKLFIG